MKTGVLISTDVAARGLDFQGVRWIVHYDINNEVKEYVNRIGRTARLNTGGKSLCLLMNEEKGYVSKLKDAGLQLSSIPSDDILSSFSHTAAKRLPQYKGSNVIGDIGNLVRTTVGKRKMVQLALGAYKSSVSSLAARSLRDKAIFSYKEVNFTDLAKGFGIAKEWMAEDKKKRIAMQGYERVAQGGREKTGRAKSEGSTVESIAQSKVKKMEEVVKKMSKNLTKSLDY